MTGLVMQQYGEDRGPLPHLGERIRAFLEPLRLSEKELARRASIDVRTARSAKEGSCGPTTFDALAKAFGWPLIEAVMTPVVGADPITALEQEILNEQRQIQAREDRLERMRAARRRAVASDGP